jgi:hypothetical protein
MDLEMTTTVLYITYGTTSEEFLLFKESYKSDASKEERRLGTSGDDDKNNPEVGTLRAQSR